MTRRSSLAILPSRSHPLRRPPDPAEIEPDALDPTPFPRGSGRTLGSLPDAAPADASERRRHTAPSPMRTARRTPAPAGNPHNDQTARPSDRRSLTERLDSRCADRHRHPRRERFPKHSPRGPGSDHPGLHLLRHSLLRRRRPRPRRRCSTIIERGVRQKQADRGQRRQMCMALTSMNPSAMAARPRISLRVGVRWTSSRFFLVW